MEEIVFVGYFMKLSVATLYSKEMGERRIVKDFEGYCRGPFQGTILELAWKD
jgi:hypothetical protein